MPFSEKELFSAQRKSIIRCTFVYGRGVVVVVVLEEKSWAHAFADDHH